MKRVLLALGLLALCAVAACGRGPNPPHPVDWGLHAAAGCAAAAALDAHTGLPRPAIWLAVAAAGVAKEASDRNFDRADAAAWLPGVFICL